MIKRLRSSSAHVNSNNGVHRLVSYRTHVATYDSNTNTFTVYQYWDCSPTTLRHVGKFAEDYMGRYLRKADIVNKNGPCTIVHG